MRVYSYFVRGAEHFAMFRTSAESVHRADPHAVILVMTDDEQVNSAWHYVRRIDPGQPIMLANIDGQVEALIDSMQWGVDSIAFIDTDTIVQRPLILSSPGGDIAVTWRDHVRVVDDEKVEGIAGVMPYNYGLILARPSRAAAEAFIWLRERVRKMHDRHQKWYGNQMALAALCGPPPSEGWRTDERRIPWHLTALGTTVRVLKLPCEIWNYTPQKAGEDVSQRAMLHFKGASRHLMEGYARAMGLGWYVEPKAAAA